MTSTRKTTSQTTTTKTTIDRNDPKREAKLLAAKIANDHPLAWRITLTTHAFPFLGIASVTRAFAFGTPGGKFSLGVMRKAAERSVRTVGLPENCPVDFDVHDTRALWFGANDVLGEIRQGRFTPEVLASDDGHAIRTGHEWLAIEAACAYARRPASNEGEVFFKLWHQRDWRRERLLRHAPEIVTLHDVEIEKDIARLKIDRAEFNAKAARAFAIIDRLPRGI